MKQRINLVFKLVDKGGTLVEVDSDISLTEEEIKLFFNAPEKVHIPRLGSVSLPDCPTCHRPIPKYTFEKYYHSHPQVEEGVLKCNVSYERCTPQTLDELVPHRDYFEFSSLLEKR